MTDLNTSARGGATGSGDRSRPRAALPALCLTLITSWGIVHYAFPVLNPEITHATGWPAGATTAAFSLALVVSALSGIRVGRVLDRRGPRAVMTAGSVLGTVSLPLVASAPNLPVFLAGWALAGLAMASTFYQPAFAALTRWWAPDHVRALTIVTLAGGLASTVFAPLTALLAEHLSWRHTYLALAGLLAALTIPAHALALRAPWPPASPAARGTTVGATPVVRSRPFWLLATAFTLSAFAMYAVVVALLGASSASGLAHPGRYCPSRPPGRGGSTHGRRREPRRPCHRSPAWAARRRLVGTDAAPDEEAAGLSVTGPRGAPEPGRSVVACRPVVALSPADKETGTTSVWGPSVP